MQLIMKYFIINILIALTCLLHYQLLTQAQGLSSDEFNLKLIENCLNLTKNNENFIVAPYEAFQLYKELYNIADDEDDAENENQSNDSHGLNLNSTPLIGVRKQQRIMHSKKPNALNDLLTSLSLTARWSFNFQTRDTHKRVFHQNGRPNQKTWVDYLRKDDTFYYSHIDQLNASILELPLNVKKIKLKIILPDKWDGLAELRDYILDNIAEFDETIKKTYKMTLVRLLLPKFHLSYKMNLKDFFAETAGKDIDEYENVYQQSKLEFNERGIGQFERTTVLFWNAYSYLRVSPLLYDINHPFLFFITNKDGIQFFGQVVKMD